MNIREHRGPERDGFSRLEAVCCIAAVALIGIVVTVEGNNGSASGRAVCANNLRQIGTALTQWIGDSPVHQVPWRVPRELGGTLYNGKAANAWYEFVWLTNEIANPKIIACPEERLAVPATTWNQFFLLRQLATSYNIGLDVTETNAGFVSGDLNMRFDADNQGCSARVNNAHQVLLFGNTVLQWTNDVHGTVGNVLVSDGRVEFTGRERLLQLVQPNDDNGPSHFIRAK